MIRKDISIFLIVDTSEILYLRKVVANVYFNYTTKSHKSENCSSEHCNSEHNILVMMKRGLRKIVPCMLFKTW